jgi:hypothetical protein
LRLDDEDVLPVDDPFRTSSRLNFIYNNSVALGQEGTQQFTLNPVLAVGERSSLQFEVPMTWYQPGNSGNLYNQGLGDYFVQYFQYFDTHSTTSHGFALNMSFDTADTNLGGAATVLGTGYAFQYKPDPENKLLLVAGYRHSWGQSDPGAPTRQLQFRLQGYHFFDDAYVSLEWRNIWDLTQGAYQPLATLSLGGELFEDFQLWGAVRLPLNEAARSGQDRLNYSVGVTVPL